LEIFQKMDSVLGILDFEPQKTETVPLGIQKQIDLRNQLRVEKKWKEADEIREELHKEGIELSDTPDGTKWKKTG